ncbi:hypothetical protein [uncultured Mediterranean phage uvMED]|nr:hypothetical protein [uncultured Mediterranean phage uvMED]
MNTINDTASNNYIEICPGCLACYNQGRLTFYWFQINKETTLEQIEQALDIENIHKKAKTPYVCGGDEVHIQDNDFGGGEYMLAEELYGLVQLLQLVPNFDYIRAFKEVFLMGDELDVNHEPTDTFKEFADNVQVFDTIQEKEYYLDEYFCEMYGVDEGQVYAQYIDWNRVREDMLLDMCYAEVGSKTYLWRSY